MNEWLVKLLGKLLLPDSDLDLVLPFHSRLFIPFDILFTRLLNDHFDVRDETIYELPDDGCLAIYSIYMLPSLN